MANKKFNDLPEVTSLNATDVFALSLNGAGSRRISSENALKKIFTDLDANNYKIINLSDPENAQDAATKAFVESVIGAASVFYFFSNTPEGVIPNYDLMYPTDTGESQSTKAAAIPANDTLIASFITEIGQPPFNILLKGIYENHIHAAKTAGTKEVQIYWKLFKRASGGAETELILSEVSPNLTGSNIAYDLHASLGDDESLASTDRLVVKFYGNPVGTGTDPTVTLYLEGTNTSRIELKTTSSLILPDEKNIYWVNSAGSNSNLGKKRQDGFLNTNNAISAIISNESLSATNRFVVENPDAHQENSFVLSVQWINLNLPQTRFSAGTNYIYSDTVTKIDEAEIDGGAICVVSSGSGVRYFYANKLRGFGLVANNLMLDITEGGLLYGKIKYFNPKSDDSSIRVRNNSIAYIETDNISYGIEVQTGSTLYLIAKNAENTIFTGGGTLYLNTEKLNGANFTGFTGTVYYFSLDNGGIVKPFLSYDAHPTFNADTQLIDKKYVDDTVGALTIPNQNVYFWGKGGSDSNTGKIWDSERFSTLGKAISEAQAQIPSFTNQFVLTCNDAGDYDEQRSITSYIHINAPNATLKSTNSTGHTLDISASEYSVVKIKEISANSSDAALSCNQDDTSYVYLDIDNVRNTGTGTGLETLAGYTLGNIKRCQKFYVGTNSYINSKIDSFTGNGDLIDGSIGSLIIGEHVSGTITKGSASNVSLQILKPGVLKFGNTTLDPIWSYSSHPTFTADTQLVDKKYVDDSAFANGSIYHEYYVTGNTAETTIVTLTVPVKVNAFTTQGNNNSYFTHSSNRLTYNGTVAKTFHVQVHLSWKMVGTTSQELCKLYIYYYDSSTAFGGLLAKSTMRGNNDNDGDAPYIISTQCLIELDTNDYIEVWVSQETGSVRNIIVNDLNVIITNVN